MNNNEEKAFSLNPDLTILSQDGSFKIDKSILKYSGVLVELINNKSDLASELSLKSVKGWVLNEIFKVFYSKLIGVKYFCKANNREDTLELLDFAMKYDIKNIIYRCENLLLGVYYITDIKCFIVAKKYKLERLYKKFEGCLRSEGMDNSKGIENLTRVELEELLNITFSALKVRAKSNSLIIIDEA